MIEVIQLIRIDFDTMENRNPLIKPLVKKCIATFVSDEVLTAKVKYDRYIVNLPPIKLYTGWDGEIYPQFRKDIIYAE